MAAPSISPTSSLPTTLDAIQDPLKNKTKEINELYEKATAELCPLLTEINLYRIKLDCRNNELDSNSWPLVETLQTELETHLLAINQFKEKLKNTNRTLTFFGLGIQELRSQRVEIPQVAGILTEDKLADLRSKMLTNQRLSISCLEIEKKRDLICELFQEAVENIKHIEEHPLKRFTQRIDSREKGMNRSGYFQYCCDKTRRYLDPLLRQFPPFTGNKSSGGSVPTESSEAKT